MNTNDLFSDKIYTVSNLLTIIRILLVPFFGYFLYLEDITGMVKYDYLALMIIVLIIITDYFDGYIARLLNQVSKLGQFLDPIADKIACTTGLFLLHIYKEFPLWIVILLVLRDLYAIIGGAFLFSKIDIQVKPNLAGKLMVTSIALTGLVYIWSPSYNFHGLTLQLISVILFAFFLVISTVISFKTYLKVYLDNKS
ncbi:MAG: CDP-alcohol phosphatidyltransferase family protein [Spirochaetota bacterium]|nr:CDP-alcohol phosphatidyltransferase family protein [Spirochaetota bacterium]